MTPLTKLNCDFTKEYKNFELDVNLDEEFLRLGLFGPSGSGKTTFLEIIAGLMKPDTGTVKVNQEVWNDVESDIMYRPESRKIGYLMQEAPLFPQQTVEENLRYPVRSKSSNLSRLKELLEIEDLIDQYPDTLSGGERRRVALAQVLNSEPELLLLDEPLIGLNETLRRRTLPAINRVLREMDIPSIVVSHRPTVVRTFCSEIIPIKDGISGEGYQTEEFFQAGKFISKDLLGENNYFEVRVQTKIQGSNLLVGTTENGLKFHFLNRAKLKIGDSAIISFSARDTILAAGDQNKLSPRNHWNGKILSIKSEARSKQLVLSVHDEKVWARITNSSFDELDISAQQTIGLLLKSHSLSVQPI